MLFELTSLIVSGHDILNRLDKNLRKPLRLKQKEDLWILKAIKLLGFLKILNSKNIMELES